MSPKSLTTAVFAVLALTASLPLTSCGPAAQASAGVLYFSAIPDDNKTELRERYDLVTAALSEELGVEFQYRPTSNYDASVEAFKNGDIQLAWFGGVSGVQARIAIPGAQAIAQGAVDPNFLTYFVCHKDVGIAPSEDFPLALKGKTFTFGSRGSTSGRLMPTHFIGKFTGMSPEEFFGAPDRFSGSHDQTALQVFRKGKHDVFLPHTGPAHRAGVDTAVTGIDHYKFFLIGSRGLAPERHGNTRLRRRRAFGDRPPVRPFVGHQERLFAGLRDIDDQTIGSVLARRRNHERICNPDRARGIQHHPGRPRLEQTEPHAGHKTALRRIFEVGRPGYLRHVENNAIGLRENEG